ncbi:MAG: universal stress protein [Desulfobacterales bacterium]|jgi:universal stress protein A
MNVQSVACCTDFSDNADRAVAAAYDLARRFEASLFILHVLPPLVNPILTEAEWIPPETAPRETILTQIEERLQERYAPDASQGVTPHYLVLEGHVSTTILAFLEEQRIDLVVLGSYGLSGMGLVLFGSVSKRVSQKAGCSVMIVREPRAHS